MMDDRPLRLLVYGAGAVGGYLGLSLALDGNSVVFLARPQTAEALRGRGLSLTIDGETRWLKNPKVAASVEEALASGPFDAALFALKSYDTQAAIEAFAPLAADLPPFLCLQNGVDNEAALAETLGSSRVIAGTVTSSIGRGGSGEFVLERQRGVGLAGEHPLSSRLAAAFHQAGLNARLYARAADMKWSKLLTNLLGNAAAAILDMPPGEVFAHPGLFRLEIAQQREALAVMRAQGIRVVDLPEVPVRALAFASRLLPPWLSRPMLRRAVGGGRGGKMPSFHIDLHGGREMTEVDYLNGAVVRAGQQMGIPTPANRLLNETLLALAAGDLPVEAFARRPQNLLGLYRHRAAESR